MFVKISLAFFISLVSLAAHAAVPQQPKAPGIESGSYIWNEQTGEKLEILKLKGDIERGKLAYRVCQGCHKTDGSGRTDGTYPQLAGQHASVLIKQMADVREGRRENPKMFPFAGKHALDMQEIADIAVYLQSLPLPAGNGKGPGIGLERGKELYQKDCQICHGNNGEGNGKKFYPLVTAQHYKYMVRQLQDIRDGKRRNANPKMVKAVQNYADVDIAVIADYLSRLSAQQ